MPADGHGFGYLYKGIDDGSARKIEASQVAAVSCMRESIDIVTGIALLTVFAAVTIVVYSAEAVVWTVGDLVSKRR